MAFELAMSSHTNKHAVNKNPFGDYPLLCYMLAWPWFYHASFDERGVILYSSSLSYVIMALAWDDMLRLQSVTPYPPIVAYYD